MDCLTRSTSVTASLTIALRLLMTTDHADRPLAEALWFALDLAISEDVKDSSESAVVIGVDDDEWRGEIRTRLANLTELRRHVVEDIPE